MTEGFPKLLSIREVARTGLLSEHALRLLIKQGHIKTIKVGVKHLINLDRLIQLLDNPACVEPSDTTSGK